MNFWLAVYHRGDALDKQSRREVMAWVRTLACTYATSTKADRKAAEREFVDGTLVYHLLKKQDIQICGGNGVTWAEASASEKTVGSYDHLVACANAHALARRAHHEGHGPLEVVLEARGALLVSAVRHVWLAHERAVCPCGRVERDGVLEKMSFKEARRRRVPSAVS